MEKQELVQAWNFIRAAAENSNGNLQYHQNLQDAIGKVAEALQEVVKSAEDDIEIQ
jgi:hypothetical protein